jgi:DNA processing protein
MEQIEQIPVNFENTVINPYVKGNSQLIKKMAVGFSGARDASAKGLSVTQECAREAVSNDLVVISGNARGVDFTAHQAALEAGGITIFVIPEGINNFKIKKAHQAFWDWSRILVVSMFEPDATWQTPHAFMRNRLIIALSRAMIVIEANIRGGTMHTGNETLKSDKTLYVANFQGSMTGNQNLISRGGKALGRNPETNKPNIERIIANF